MSLSSSIVNGFPVSPFLFMWFAFWFSTYLSSSALSGHFYAHLLVWSTFLIGPFSLFVGPLVATLYWFDTAVITTLTLALCILAYSVMAASAAFTDRNKLHWALPLLVVAPPNVCLTLFLLSVPPVRALFETPIAQLAKVLGVYVPDELMPAVATLLGALRWTFDFRLQLLLVCVGGLIGIFGVMESIKASVKESPLLYGATKAWLALLNSLRAIRPVFQIWLYVTIGALRRLIPAMVFPVILVLFYILIAWNETSVSLLGVFKITGIMVTLFFAIPLFIHLSSGYRLRQFFTLTFDHVVKAGQNVLLWTLFSALASSIFLKGAEMDYPKVMTALILFIWLSIYGFYRLVGRSRRAPA